MAVPESFYDVSAANNLKNLSEFNTMHYAGMMIDAQRTRQQLADFSNASVARINGILENVMQVGLKTLVEPDMAEAMAVAEMSTRVSPTSQNFHQANGQAQLGYIADILRTLVNKT